MNTSRNIKIFIGLFYIILLSIFLYLFFSKFSIEEISSYKFIQDNREQLINLKETNLLLLSIGFIVFIIIWVLLLGFGSPTILLSGFVFGKWIGVLISIFSLSVGATLLYMFGNFFFKEPIKEKFLSRFKNLEDKFRKNEFIFFLVYRFVGGIPFAIANLLPVLFNVRVKNYFLGTFLGLMPQGFVLASLGGGLEKIIKNNDTMPSLFDLFFSPDIYLPILSFIFLILVALIVKKKFYKN